MKLKILKLFILFLSLTNCKKNFHDYNEDYEVLLNAFFEVKSNLKTENLEILNKIKAYNTQTEFVSKIPKNSGIPIWNKLIKTTNSLNRFSNNQENTYLVPLTNDNISLSSIMIFKEKNDNLELKKMFTNQSFLADVMNSQIGKLDKQKQLNLFMFVDYLTFGNKIFKSIPKSLTDISFPQTIRNTTNIYIDTVLVKKNNSTSFAIENCWSINVNVQVCGSESICGGNCDWNSPSGCSWVCCYSETQTLEVCSSTEIVTGGLTLPSFQMGSGGGGGGGGSSQLNQCNAAWYRKDGPPCEFNGLDPNDNDNIDCDPFITTLRNNTAFTSRFATLNTADILDLPFEHGHFVNDLATNSFTNEQGSIGDPNILWNLNFGQKIMGMLHSHYGSLNSMFSPGDIFAMSQMYVYGYVSDTTNFFFGLTSRNGDPYLIKVANTQKFRKFAEKVIKNEKENNFSSKYARKFNFQNNDLNIVNFFDMLSDIESKDCMDMYEGNVECNEWTKISVSNKIVHKNKCN